MALTAERRKEAFQAEARVRCRLRDGMSPESEALVREILGPEFFTLLVSRRVRSPEEWVSVAEEMAQENGGALQGSLWLNKNGYKGLDAAMRRHPKLFAHIPQRDHRGKSAEEHVPEAERLARDNGGEIPRVGWLVKNGYNGLNAAMRKRSELFAHISQRERTRHSEAWVPIAESMALENDGALQGSNWLQKNGHNKLRHSMEKHPKLFAHIPQEIRKGAPGVSRLVGFRNGTPEQRLALEIKHGLRKA